MAGAVDNQQPIRVIDISNIAARKEQVTKELMDGATGVGFFQVCGHGIGPEEVASAFAASKSFLDQPDEAKSSVKGSNDNFAYALGWTEETVAGNRLRSGILCGYDHERMRSFWPSDELCPNFKANTLKFMRRCHEVTLVIMSCLAHGLGLPEDTFTQEMDVSAEDNQTAVFLNHYPSVEGKSFPDGVLRIGAHTDFELLTLLFNEGEIGGLEVLAGKDTTTADAQTKGVWTPMNPRPGCITVNIGDALQYWSDGRLKSTFHRVRVPENYEFQGDRYSMAYFANAKASTVFQGASKKYPPIQFAEILAKKAAYFANRDDMTDEELVKTYSQAMGPEFEPSTPEQAG